MPDPRVCLFLGTKDFNYPKFDRHVRDLTVTKGAFSMNRVADLGHNTPGDAYLAGALHWVLEGTGPTEKNDLPLKPPSISDSASPGARGRPPGSSSSQKRC